MRPARQLPNAVALITEPSAVARDAGGSEHYMALISRC
jgi:hypothetical protein